MPNRNFLSLAALSLALLFVSTAQAQWHPDFDRAKGQTPRIKTVAKTKSKTRNTKQNHDRYANQEVGYRKGKGNEVAVESLEKSKGPKNQVVFEPNNEPLWAKRKAKDQTIALENDEAQRTKPRPKIKAKKPASVQSRFN